MRFVHSVIFLAAFSVAFAAVPAAKNAAKKTTPVKSAAKKTAPVKSAAKKGAPATKSASKAPVSASKRTVARKGAKGKGMPVASGWRSRQTVPTPDRYKEIQTALAEKGYLKSEPNGVWDAQSTEALKQFQADHQMMATGKITSSALIGLGLGPNHNAPASALPPAPPPASAPIPYKEPGAPASGPVQPQAEFPLRR